MHSVQARPDFIDHLGKYGSTAEGAGAFFDAVYYATKHAMLFFLGPAGQATAAKVATFADTTSAALGWPDLVSSGNQLRHSYAAWSSSEPSKSASMFKQIIHDSASLTVSGSEGMRALAMAGVVGISSSSPILSMGVNGGFFVLDSMGFVDAAHELCKENQTPEDTAIQKTRLVKHGSRWIMAVLGLISLIYTHVWFSLVCLFAGTVSLLAKTRLFSLEQSKKDNALPK